VARIQDPRKDIESRFVKAEFVNLGENEHSAPKEGTREECDAGTALIPS